MNVTAYITGGLALTVAVMYGLWTYQVRTRDAQLEVAKALVSATAAQVVEAKTVNDENAATLAAIRADLARQQEAAAKYQALAATRASSLQQALKRIKDAPLSDDGVVAPVLARELTGLRVVGPVPSGPAADSVGQDGSTADPDLITPVLPAPSGAPGS